MVRWQTLCGAARTVGNGLAGMLAGLGDRVRRRHGSAGTRVRPGRWPASRPLVKLEPVTALDRVTASIDAGAQHGGGRPGPHQLETFAMAGRTLPRIVPRLVSIEPNRTAVRPIPRLTAPHRTAYPAPYRYPDTHTDSHRRHR